MITEEDIIEALRPTGQEGLSRFALAKQLGVQVGEVNRLINSLMAQDAVRMDEWPADTNPDRQPPDPGHAYYLPMFDEPGDKGGVPLASAVSARHDCPHCVCTIASAEDKGARDVVRVQQGILRTLRRNGPMTLAAIKREGFRAPDRSKVGPALAAMEEVGKVFAVSPGVWKVAE